MDDNKNAIADVLSVRNGYKIHAADKTMNLANKTIHETLRFVNYCPNDVVRFFNYLKNIGDDDCWIWGKFKDSDGYGLFSINRRTVKAHRFSYMIHNGKIPDGFLVCHRCDNPSCNNPRHLFLGTSKDNLSDMAKKGRSARGAKNFNCKLSEKQVLEIRKICHERKTQIKQIAKSFGVCHATIIAIRNRRIWRHI